MKHFGPKGGHFCRFGKGDDINAFCRRRDARVGGVDTRDIGPDIDTAGVQRFAQQSRGIVAAAATQGCRTPFRFAADKALSDHQTFSQARSQLQLRQLGQCGNVWLGAAEAIVGAHNFTHIEPL